MDLVILPSNFSLTEIKISYTYLAPGILRFIIKDGSLFRAAIYTPYSFNSAAYVWVLGAKTTGPIAKKFFLESNFFGSEKFQVSAHVLQK
jgi:hypothetical protein